MSGVGRPPAATLGKTRTCPHCKATVLESANVCPGCRHHLRFDPGSVQREEQSFTAWKVDGIIGPRGSVEACEYSVVIALRNEEGRELARHVVSVGALQPHERRAFSLAVEVISPRTVSAAPALEAAALPAKPLPGAPNPSAPNRAPPAPPPRPGATLLPPGVSPGSSRPLAPAASALGGPAGARSPAARSTGRSAAESPPGAASRFTARAPAARPDPPPAIAAPRGAAPSPAAPSPASSPPRPPSKDS